VVKGVYELDVYVLAEELADLVWNQYDDWPNKAKHTMGYQVIRAADSISANLSEGYGRYTPADRKTFYRYARGSFEETKCWLRKATRRGLIDDVEPYKKVIDELGPKLNAFIKSTDKKRVK